MNQITHNHDFYTTTETSRSYVDHGRQPRTPKAPALVEEAVLLMRNKYRNNLRVDHETPTVVEAPPDTARPARRLVLPIPEPTDYREYANRLAECYPRLLGGEICTEHIKRMMGDRHRTVYHTDYCAAEDGIVSAGTRRREAVRRGRLPPGWLIDTTYQASYRSVNQIRDEFDYTPRRSDSLKPPVGGDRQLKAKLHTIFKVGETEYGERLSNEADQSLEIGRYGRPRRYGYLDRYTKGDDPAAG